MYLSKVQVLSNVYLKLHLSASTYVLGLMHGCLLCTRMALGDTIENTSNCLITLIALLINELMYNSATSCHKWIAFKPHQTVSLHAWGNNAGTASPLLHSRSHWTCAQQPLLSWQYCICKLEVPSLTPIKNTNIHNTYVHIHWIIVWWQINDILNLLIRNVYLASHQFKCSGIFNWTLH